MKSNEYDEMSLIEGAKNNDNRAFKEILTRYKLPVFFMIYQMVNNITIAEDLTMESFEKAFQNIHRFTPRYKISTWIFTIAKNHTIDYKRVNDNKPKLDEIDIRQHDSHVPSPEDLLLSNEQVSVIENAVKNIKGVCREIVSLRMEGLSYKEISETLSMPLGTVQSYLFRTRQEITRTLSK